MLHTGRWIRLPDTDVEVLLLGKGIGGMTWLTIERDHEGWILPAQLYVRQVKTAVNPFGMLPIRCLTSMQAH